MIEMYIDNHWVTIDPPDQLGNSSRPARNVQGEMDAENPIEQSTPDLNEMPENEIS